MVIKPLMSVFLSIRNKLMFVPGRLFQPSLMFVETARSSPSGIVERRSTWVGPGITRKY